MSWNIIDCGGRYFEVTSDSATVFSINDTLCTVNPLYLRDDNSPFYMRDIVVLEWNEGVSEGIKNTLIAQYQMRLSKSTGPLEHYEINNTLTAANELFETNYFKYCYPEFLVEVVDHAYLPFDPWFGRQWYLYNWGQPTNDGIYGTPGADIKALAAWDITTGSSDVVVAVIDRGVTYNHPDLPASRLEVVSYSNQGQGDGLTWHEPFPTPNTYNNAHGDNVAGIIAASHNYEGIAGICPECRIMPLKWGGYDNPDYWAPITIESCTQIAIENNADIITFSLGVGVTESLVSAINLATEQGIVVVSSSGNYANHLQNINAPVTFPANIDNPDVISVGASDHNDLQANYSATQEEIDVVAPSNTAYPWQIAGESWNIWTIDIPGDDGSNPWVSQTDVILPQQGEQLPSSGTNHLAYTGRFGGTSAAAPMVSGIAALMLSVNPCLTPEKVKKIILNTADKVGPYDYNWNPEKPGHSKEMGYGRVNAHAAVVAASMDIDLYTEDIPGDEGVEPNEISEILWASEDIWVRNQPDGTTNQVNENPNFVDENTPVYVYVRVRNKGCNESLGTEELHLYWSKAATALTWPEYWDGSITTLPLLGDEIGIEVIPPIGTNDETIIAFEWYPPNPEDYENEDIDQPWHFCLLSRIVTPHDPMINELTSGDWNLGHNVKQNNNISWKNVSIINVEPGSAGGPWADDKVVGATVAIGNASDTSGVFNWSLKIPEPYPSTTLLDLAEIRIILDSLSWQKWTAGGRMGQNVRIVNERRRQILVTGKHAKLQNLAFAAHERGLLSLSFNFLTRNFSGTQEFDYHVIQSHAATGSVLGGEKYQIRASNRDLFIADGGDDKEIYRDEEVEITAEDINEDAIYNWYDPEGNLIHTGQNLVVTPQITIKYKLEVIAETDGFKDYDEVEVVVKTAEIKSISPNPVSSMLTVIYDAKNVDSAYLILTRAGQSGVTNNYILDINSEEVLINVSSLAQGVYHLILVADGEVVDQEGVIIQ